MKVRHFLKKRWDDEKKGEFEIDSIDHHNVYFEAGRWDGSDDQWEFD